MLLSLGVAADLKVHVDRQAQIEEIASSPGVLWRAGANIRFAHDAPGASKPLCGVKGDWQQEVAEAVKRGDVPEFSPSLSDALGAGLPERFESAENWPQCNASIEDIRDQSNCGCCWAFAAVEAASDRMCISNASMLMPLSAEDVCFCALDDGCNGGSIIAPWLYIQQSGVVTGGQFQGSGPFGEGFCSDFSLPHCHHHGPRGDDPYPDENSTSCPLAKSPTCPSRCDSSAAAPHNDFDSDKYTFESGKWFIASNETQIQEAVFAGGPVEVAFTVYSDFENYAGGIYHHVTGQSLGGHAVKIVGWGSENGTKYWRVANSWNPYWGERGFFRILRGTNECGIESRAVASSPSAVWSKFEKKPKSNVSHVFLYIGIGVAAVGCVLILSAGICEFKKRMGARVAQQREATLLQAPVPAQHA